ncbi:MAG: hypothetical protein R3C68_12440 [Myxococcota bacterium]
MVTGCGGAGPSPISPRHFLFARMWRRSGVITDAGDHRATRYSGKPAALLRAFKAVYFGVFINCLTLAWVIAAMVKIQPRFLRC